MRTSHARGRDLSVVLATLAWVVAVAILGVARHRGLHTQLNDLGNADQALWSLTTGDWAMTQTNTPDGIFRPRLAVHANLLFYPLAAFYLLSPRPELLLVLPAVACSATALLLYAGCRVRLGHWAPIVPIGFLASPPVQDAALFDFHVTSFMALWLVAAWLAIRSGRPGLAGLFVLLLLATKEDGALVAAAFGVSNLLAGRRRFGATVVVASAAWLAVTVLVLVPSLTDGASFEKLAADNERFRWLGATPGEALATLLGSPGRVLGVVLAPERLRIVAYLALLGGAWAWRGGRWLLPGLVPIAIALLSTLLFMTRVSGTYYYVVTEAAVGIALAEAALRPELAGRVVAVALATLALSPLPYGWRTDLENFRPSPQLAAVAQVARRIPPDGFLCVQNNLGPHVSQRREVAVLNRGCLARSPAFVLLAPAWWAGRDGGVSVQTRPRYLFSSTPEELATVARELASGVPAGLRPIAWADGVWLFAREGLPMESPGEAQARMERDLERLDGQLARAADPVPAWLLALNADGWPW